MPLGDITKAHSVVPQIWRVGYTRGRARLGTGSGREYTTEKRSRGEVYIIFPQEWLSCLVEKSELSQISLKYFRSEYFLRNGIHLTYTPILLSERFFFGMVPLSPRMS